MAKDKQQDADTDQDAPKATAPPAKPVAMAIPTVPSAEEEAKLFEADRLAHIPQWMEHPANGAIRCDAREAAAWAKLGYAPVTIDRAKKLDGKRAVAIAEAEVAAEKQREANKLTRLERELADLRAQQGRPR